MNAISKNCITTRILCAVAMAVAVEGCGEGAASVRIEEQTINPSRSGPREDPVGNNPAVRYQDGHLVLRHQPDPARARIWALMPDGVELHDAANGRKLAHIQLPEWLRVDESFNCAPDLALGPGGEVLVTSNVMPTIWRIDPVTFAVTRHELALDEDTGKDVGFTAMAYSAELAAYFAVSAMHGSLWRIDPLLKRAQKVTLSEPVPRACGLAALPRASNQRKSRFDSLCVRGGQNEWIVGLASSQRSGYVSARQCAG